MAPSPAPISDISSLRAVQVPLGWAPASLRLPAGLTSAVGCRVPDPHPGWSPGLWLAAFERHWLGWFITVLAIRSARRSGSIC